MVIKRRRFIQFVAGVIAGSVLPTLSMASPTKTKPLAIDPDVSWYTGEGGYFVPPDFEGELMRYMAKAIANKEDQIFMSALNDGKD